MKTLSILSMVCVATMSATPLFAESFDAFEDSNFAADTVNTRTETESAKSYHFGRREVIFDDNGIHFLKDRNNFDSSFDDDDQRNGYSKPYYENNSNGGSSQENNQGSKPKPKKYRYFGSNLTSFDIGVAQFASQTMSLTLNDNDNYLDHRGIQLSGCFSAAGLPIIDRHLGLCVGVGGKIDSYTFSNKNLVLEKGNTHLIHETDTVIAHKKSKLTNTYLTIPVVVEAHAKGAWLMVGVEGNLLAWSNTKMKTSSGEKNRTHSNFYQNLLSYNLVAKVGADCIGAFVRASMSPMFQDGKGPEVYLFSAGISLTF